MTRTARLLRRIERLDAVRLVWMYDCWHVEIRTRDGHRYDGCGDDFPSAVRGALTRHRVGAHTC